MHDAIQFKEKIGKYVTNLGIILVTMLILYVSYVTFYAAPLKKKMLGNQAPRFITTDIHENKFVFDNQVGTKIILLNFWATWCHTCQEEMPYLNDLQNSFAQSDFVIYGILEDLQPNISAVREAFFKYTAHVPVDFPIIVDSTNEIAELYGTHKLPESYLIDYGGNVFYKHEGPITADDIEFIKSMIKQIM
ncbi:MAG: TlpA disulfide reductase family protein [bacterium]|nr:TlpA family protein disulfide reductase [bacterium]MBU1917734.1 TlpA family protein disulfide reductase [bacterium]